MSKVVTWVCDGACGVSVEQARRPAGWYTRGAEHYCAADRPGPPRVKLKRGTCPECGQDRALNKNGSIRGHPTDLFWDCIGRYPGPDLRLTRAQRQARQMVYFYWEHKIRPYQTRHPLSPGEALRSLVHGPDAWGLARPDEVAGMRDALALLLLEPRLCGGIGAR